MSDIVNFEGHTAKTLWQQLQGFEPPCCPECGYKAVLDEFGYWCERCSDADAPNPAVDDIPNGAEFAAYLEEWQRRTRHAR